MNEQYMITLSSGSRSGNPKRAPTVKPITTCFVGYEYECPLGHRFFVTPDKLSMDVSTVGCYAWSNNWWAVQLAWNRNSSRTIVLLVLVFSFKRKEDTPWRSEHYRFVPTQDSAFLGATGIAQKAQLQRLFITTPETIALRVNPKVQFFLPSGATDDGVNKWVFDMGKFCLSINSCWGR